MVRFTSTEPRSTRAGASLCHGALLIAIDPSRLLGDDDSKRQDRADQIFDAVTGQGARLLSPRRFDARVHSERDGVRIPPALYGDVMAL